MITIEKVSNGYIMRVEEGDEDSTVVFQKEYNMLNVALGALCNDLIKRWAEPDEVVVKVDIQP